MARDDDLDLDLELGDDTTTPTRPRRATEIKDNWSKEVAELLKNSQCDGSGM